MAGLLVEEEPQSKGIVESKLLKLGVPADVAAYLANTDEVMRIAKGLDDAVEVKVELQPAVKKFSWSLSRRVLDIVGASFLVTLLGIYGFLIYLCARYGAPKLIAWVSSL